MKYQNDIDKMNTNRNLFLMSLPIFVELLLQLLVGNVDQMMVSRVPQPSGGGDCQCEPDHEPGNYRAEHGIDGGYRDFVPVSGRAG